MAQWADDVLGPASLVALLVAAVLTAVALRRLDGTRWPDSLRRRFVLGVPWGTAIVVGLVLFVYLVVQGAWESLSDPLVVPFRSWSYAYPLGMLTASFAHGSLGHVTGNLLSTVVFAPVVEYAWGHYPAATGSQERDEPETHEPATHEPATHEPEAGETEIGETETGERAVGENETDRLETISADGASLLDRPAGRIGAFVAAAVSVGLAASLFVPGPSVGFSGVVFAFAGVALVVAPLRAILAILGVRVVRTLYYAAVDPAPVATARTQYVQPWFADISIQGHAFGLVVGVLVGLLVLRQRTRSPPIRYVWFGTLAFAVTEALYALYWYRGAESVQLFRGAGTALVLVLAVVVAAAVARSATVGRPGLDLVTGRTPNLTWDHLAVAVLLALVVGIGVSSIPHNLADVSGVPNDEGADPVEVRDYTVFYAEDVPHGYAGAVPLPWVADDLRESARASGVIVASERRNAWQEAVPAGRLALDGRATVSVGGPGWRERVVTNRTGWNAVDAGETYKVFLQPPDGPRTVSYTAEPVALSPQVAGHNLSIDPADPGYELNVTRNGTTVERVALPAVNETVTVAGFDVERRGDSLFAAHEGTRVRLARYERERE